jgi:hypothetical protein
MNTQKLSIALVISSLMTLNIVHGQNFTKLQQSSDSTYGFTDHNPLKLKQGDPVESIRNSQKFLNGLKTATDQSLVIVGRYSVIDPNYKEPPGGILASLGDGGILDRYQLVNSITKDTIALYIDIYHKGNLMIPLGLKYVKP